MDELTGKMDDKNEVHLRLRKMDLIIGEMYLIRNKTQRNIQILYGN